MGKYAKKRAGKIRHGAVIALLAVLLSLLAVFVMMRGLNDPGDEGGSPQADPLNGSETVVSEQRYDDVADVFPNADPAGDNTEASIAFSDAAAFPLVLEDGKLEIESLILYDGLNPDCGNQEGYDIAAVIVRNLSDAYLERAELSMVTDCGDMLAFAVTDLPAGAAAIAFSQDNVAVEADVVCGDVTCEAFFSTGASMSEDRIAVSVEGAVITLQNKTNQDLSNIVVYCHGSLGDQYFGGITYTYPVQTLPANGSAAVEAVDCILGLAEVVRVTIN